MDETTKIGVVVDDMFFASKINAAVAQAGGQVERIKNQEQLKQLATAPPSLVIIDLNSDRIDPIEAIELLKSTADLSAIPVVSFVSHVQTDLIRRAQAAGCDYVLPRSAFSQLLGEIASGNLSSLRRSQT
jgi:DNA-binding NarL/FixJ family response regulator